MIRTLPQSSKAVYLQIIVYTNIWLQNATIRIKYSREPCNGVNGVITSVSGGLLWTVFSRGEDPLSICETSSILYVQQLAVNNSKNLSKCWHRQPDRPIFGIYSRCLAALEGSPVLLIECCYCRKTSHCSEIGISLLTFFHFQIHKCFPL